MEDKSHEEYGCYVDDCDGEGCVFDGADGLKISDCNLAGALAAEGKGRDDCQWWQKLHERIAAEYHDVTCPKCGHNF